MREMRQSGSVRGAGGNPCPYRDYEAAEGGRRPAGTPGRPGCPCTEFCGRIEGTAATGFSQ